MFLRGLAGRRTPLPREVQLEVTNRCNFDCRMCPRRILNVPDEDVRPEVFDALLRNLSGVRDLGLTGWGEPLFHRDFIGLLERGREAAPHVRMHFTTNGLLLRDATIAGVLRHGVRSISVSLDTVREGDLPGHRQAAAVIKNLESLMAARGASPTPQLILQTTLQGDGEADLREIVALGRRLRADGVNLVRLDTRGVEGLSRPGVDEERRLIRAAEEAAGGRLPVLAINKPWWPVRVATHGGRLCLRTLYHVYVDVHGNVSPCCVLRRMIVGNLLEQPLTEIWNSRAMRRFFANQKEICAACDAWRIEQVY